MLTVSVDAARLGLAGRVDGKGIAYVYYEVLIKDENSERYYGPVIREHVRAVGEKETRGVCRPDWTDPVEVSLDVDLTMRLLTDGERSAFCFAVPEGYTAASHRVGGIYVAAVGTGPLRAVVDFDASGKVTRVVARKDRGRASTLREIVLKKGDTFTPAVEVLTHPSADAGWDVATAGSNTLTVGKRPLHVVTEALLPGEYLAGLLVQDPDGRLSRRYAPFTVHV
jgi:hypothetical protein